MSESSLDSELLAGRAKVSAAAAGECRTPARAALARLQSVDAPRMITRCCCATQTPPPGPASTAAAAAAHPPPAACCLPQGGKKRGRKALSDSDYEESDESVSLDDESEEWEEEKPRCGQRLSCTGGSAVLCVPEFAAAAGTCSEARCQQAEQYLAGVAGAWFSTRSCCTFA